MNVDAVSAFIASLTWANVPDVVQQRARLALVDTVGCMLAGSKTSAAMIARSAASRNGTFVPPVMRALGDGIASSALDYDDGHYEGGGTHLGSIIVPALLSASLKEMTIKEILCALVAGYEVTIRAGYLIAPRQPNDSYHSTGAPGCIGAAAAAAKLLCLDQDGIRRALRISSAHMPMATLQLPMVKESIGWGAATAVAATFLAAEGFDGSADAVRLCPVLNIPPTPFDIPDKTDDSFVASLGQVWHLPAVYVKPYACCRVIHSALDGLRSILAEQSWRYDDIDRIEVATLSGAASLDYRRPLSPEHAQFSFPYALGCVAVCGGLGPAEMTEESLNDPSILAVAERVVLRGDPELDRAPVSNGYPAKLTVYGSGQQISRRIDHAIGGPRSPWGKAEFSAKFLHNAESVLSPEQARMLLSQLLGPLENPVPAQLLHW